MMINQKRKMMMKTERTITVSRCDNNNGTGVIIERAYKNDHYIKTDARYYVGLSSASIQRVEGLFRNCAEINMTFVPVIYSDKITMLCYDNDWREVN
jgi:hypothetical protein